MIMKKFGWCYIGAGAIAFKTARELMQKENNRIVSVWNRTHQKALDFAKEFNAKAYERVEDAINDPEVEGVYIALTNDKHYEYMKLCIAHHKPILCEKPFTMNKKEAEEIFALAEKEGVYVSEAMWTWHNSIANKIKEWVDKELVGKIQNVKCTFGFPMIFRHKSIERLINPELLGGCLLDIGVYGLRYSLELFGMPKEIRSSGHLKYGVDMNERITFIYDGFTVSHRFSINTLVGETYVIKGDRGTIEAPLFHLTKNAKIKGEYNESISDDSLLYEKQFTNVANEIRSGLLTSKFVSKENTIKCMELMDICREQLGVIYPYEK